jgi:lysophospholipase L1-like esterase
MRQNFFLFLLTMLSVSTTLLRATDAATPEPRTVDYDWMSVATWKEKHAADVAIAQKGGVDLLFVGDSITEGWEWGDGEHWKRHFAPLGAANFGVGGDTTQNLLWRLDNGDAGALKPKVVVVLIGTNNLGRENATPAEAARGAEAVVTKLRAAFPEAKIVLHGIFPCDYSPNAEVRQRVKDVNAKLARLDGFDGKVVFRDIGPLFLEPDGSILPAVSPDGLHLTPEGYRRWASVLAPLVRELLGSEAK